MEKYIESKKSNCKNCYKCIRKCAVKSLSFLNDQANIIGDDCIYCGECYLVCPQDAKYIHSDANKVKAWLAEGKQLVTSIAPSYNALNDTDFFLLKQQLLDLGFTDVQETAIGAYMVKNTYETLCANMQNDVIISSCCHSVNLLIQKHFPEALNALANVVTPMEAHARKLKDTYPEAKVVFIGPCISKKAEIDDTRSSTDVVLTFDELLDLGLSAYMKPVYSTGDYQLSTRSFPISGGILSTMKQEENRTYLVVDGQENCVQTIQDVIDGKIHHCFIEMSLCSGSCAGGPVLRKSGYTRVPNTLHIQQKAKQHGEILEIDIPNLETTFESRKQMTYRISDQMINEVLANIGKLKVEDELNCGGCGYNTCREKAIAVIQGKANLEMCLPYLRDRAETFSDNIIRNTPNGIIVLNEEFEIEQMNEAACKIFNIEHSFEIIGDQVVRLLDPKLIMDTYFDGKNTYDKQIYLAEFDKHINLTVIADRAYHILICIIRDISDDIKLQSEQENYRKSTIEITDQLIDKQMRTVQEIASLLGETTAETKVALTKLKESMARE
ncbi:iron only hydrogenase large subunit-like protein [Breznakia blatticola]|uniref:Iron only hydrogenase large subunit-like protein n=1 Tax=Breznakia blatticola TaxID=1754012 RepID=A0A4R8A4N7_9FIRM|nr:[Fe-Fe] hydrogenase large subunit C-terminal domain-containing protein [Breznakia blatticola]TDW25296.1 iron only hydrogenase large subunit-like protein [Breznakia blatticola]